MYGIGLGWDTGNQFREVRGFCNCADRYEIADLYLNAIARMSVYGGTS